MYKRQAEVIVHLYKEGDTVGIHLPIAADTTDADGTYLFDQIDAGAYYVHIPASEFADGEPLENKQSVKGYGGDDSNDDDTDENGLDSILTSGGVSSVVIDLYPGLEPTGESGIGLYDGDLADANVNLTIDFGFESEGVALGNLVFMDLNKDGSYNRKIDRGIAQVTVCLLYTSPSPRDQRGSRMPSSA